MFPTFVFSLRKVLQGALRFLAQVLDRFDINLAQQAFLLLLKLQAIGTSLGEPRALCLMLATLNKTNSSIQGIGKIESCTLYVNWKDQVTNFWDNGFISCHSSCKNGLNGRLQHPACVENTETNHSVDGKGRYFVVCHHFQEKYK